MIVPQFKLRQTETCLQIFIRLPYVKVSSCEFHIEANLFKFYLKPYLLSLCFQQRLREVEEPVRAIYYQEKYVLEVHLEKESAGEVFEDLDIIASLLNPKRNKKNGIKTLVQVVGEKTSNYGVVLEEGDRLEVNTAFNYGFGLSYSKVFENLEQQEAELFSFSPRSTAYGERKALSAAVVSRQFDIESYLFDKYENEEETSALINCREYDSYLAKREEERKGVDLNYSDFKAKLRLSSKELLISPTAKGNVIKEIVSILFSYFYELVCMGGQLGTQSAKTINKTSAVLGCNYLYYGEDVKEVLVDCCRRCVTYSLYKSLEICQVAQKYVVSYLTGEGVRLVLQDLRGLMEKSEPRYLLNRIYIDDYLLYVYSCCNSQELAEWVAKISTVVVTERDLSLGIEEYEREGQSEGEQEQKAEIKQLVTQLQNLQTLD